MTSVNSFFASDHSKLLRIRRSAILCAMCFVFVILCSVVRSQEPSPTNDRSEDESNPLCIGSTFDIDSTVLKETRTVNVFQPTVYGAKIESPMPVLYMLDGGLNEDFLHIAGLLQVFTSNGTIRPFTLVGIPNTNRRRDLTGPTNNADDKKIAPQAGGSERFRQFMREELFPEIKKRFRVNSESALMGESFAGLFVLETFVESPELFDTYIAIDPSLWWNDHGIVDAVERGRPEQIHGSRKLFVASSNEPSIRELNGRFVNVFQKRKTPNVDFTSVHFEDESHATIYHPAAMKALRSVLGPISEAKKKE